MHRTGYLIGGARVRHLVFALVLFGSIPTSAAAQDQRTVGVTMGYPASIGVLWHVSPRVAIRPEFSFATTSSEFTSALGTVTASDVSAVGVGASGIFYLTDQNKLRTYVSPRFTYARTTSKTEANGISAGSEGSGKSYSAGASFGAQYGLGDRFSVFGEVGLGYADQRSSSDISAFQSSTVSHTWSSRTGVGVVLYF
jgi:opacity protein-like surface antigen